MLEGLPVPLARALADSPIPIVTALDDGLDASLAAERAHQHRAGCSDDHAERVRALRAKRPPVFNGR